MEIKKLNQKMRESLGFILYVFILYGMFLKWFIMDEHNLLGGVITMIICGFIILSLLRRVFKLKEEKDLIIRNNNWILRKVAKIKRQIGDNDRIIARGTSPEDFRVLYLFNSVR